MTTQEAEAPGKEFMSNIIISSNMSLPIPVVGVDLGPDYALNVDNCLAILDSHNHSIGNGVQITPNGLNLNSNVSFLGNSAVNLLSANFNSQPSALVGTNFLSFILGNLYANDGSGNQIQITSGGGVAGSPGSIGSLVSPASATYSAGGKTFTWQSGVSKAAAMDNGAVTIRQTDTASANGITISSPNALGTNYGLVLPAALPVSTQYLTSDVSGNLSFSTSNQIVAAETRSTGTTVGTGGVAISNIVSSFSTTSISPVDVTNLSVTITTSGRPVYVGLMDGLMGISAGTSGGCVFNVLLLRGSTAISISGIAINATTFNELVIPTSSMNFVDVIGAGTYTYKAQISVASGATGIVENAYLIAYEL